MSIVTLPAPSLGPPFQSWMFALRIWVATMLALYAAFWLQIDGAASAATCVAILAQQTRGQAYHKALYRFVGTVVGAVAAVAVTGLFSQSRDLLLLSFAAWIALSVFVAGSLDGSRAYGAQLSGYTVALVAVQLIDTPQQVFLAGLNRTAAIVIGIVAIGLVNDLLAAPAVQAGLMARLRTLGGQVGVFATACSRGEGVSASVSEAARLLAAVTALHADIIALPSESVSGGARGAAARRLAQSMIRQIFASRAKLESRVGKPCPPTDHSEAFEHGMAAALAILETGMGDSRGTRLPIFRSRAAAAQSAARTFLVLAASEALFAASGWPSTSVAVSLVAVTMALSSTAPASRTFALCAAVATPAAIAAVGITEFLLLDGVSDFPLLGVAMAPTIAGACLLIGTGKPPLAPIGFLFLVFFTIFLSPANPQNYNPQTYVVTAVLALASVVILVVGLTAILPTSDEQRRRWLLGSAASELKALLAGHRQRSSGALVRDADRIAQAASLRVGGSGTDDLTVLFWMADMAESAARTSSVVATASKSDRVAVARALRTLDAQALGDIASRVDSAALAMALSWSAQLIERRPIGTDRLLREGRP